mmetsp:Transcript_116372/g.324269  ORF Transcript_116372/g.324269 Transcript_116372/m.324269 type:complete len:341 (-) Transcript_116372:146-1168(-)
MLRSTAGPQQYGLHALLASIPPDDEAVERGARLLLLPGPVPGELQLETHPGARLHRRRHGHDRARGAELLTYRLRHPGRQHALREPEAHAAEPLALGHGAEAGRPDLRHAHCSAGASGVAGLAARPPPVLADAPGGIDIAPADGPLGIPAPAARQRQPRLCHECLARTADQAELCHCLHTDGRYHEGCRYCGGWCDAPGRAAEPAAGCWLHDAARGNLGVVAPEGRAHARRRQPRRLRHEGCGRLAAAAARPRAREPGGGEARQQRGMGPGPGGRRHLAGSRRQTARLAAVLQGQLQHRAPAQRRGERPLYGGRPEAGSTLRFLHGREFDELGAQLDAAV